jgi:SecD/SecF fusion protein
MKKNKEFIVNLLLMLALILCMVSLLPIILNNLKFGLDLQGGFEVLYQVSSVDGSEVDSERMTNTYKALLRRIDILGVSEPVITIEGDDKIRVQLAGVTDQESARTILSSAATLTFRDTDDNLLMTSDVLSKASVGQDQSGLPAVSLSIADKDEFYKVTKKVSQKEDNVIVIWLDYEEGVDSYANEKSKCGSEDSRCLSAATVSEGFSSDVIIQGNFTSEEVQTLVSLINSGSLPTKLTEISSKTVGASFGEDSLSKTFIAGLIGFAIVVLIMIALYHFAGFISSIGLLVYTVLTFGIFWLVGGVLTLPGIAAILLGIGMAVDANVINFERIKDEINNGASFQSAFKKGNKNSIKTIIDANLTTFIVAIILFIFGESTVKGFATMLIITTITTMVIMVFFTRFLLKLFVKTNFFDDKVNLFIGKIKKQKRTFDFVKNGNKFLILVIVLFVVGIISLCINGLNLGVDFKGGTSISIKGEETLDADNIRKELEEKGYEIVDEEIEDNSIYYKISDQLDQEEILELQDKFETDYEASADIGVVSTEVKKELIKNAILSVILASIAIILYISVRFQFNFAISAIIALLHDVFLIIAVFSLCKLEVQTIFIAALLSTIGYSINDTIVIFDRIRENKEKNQIKTKEDLKNVVNDSLNQTIKRSFITSITTMVTVISLILFGSSEIFNFNIALLIGLVAGTYSSIFIASQLWLKMDQKNIGKPKKKKWYEETEPTEKKVKGINA